MRRLLILLTPLLLLALVACGGTKPNAADPASNRPGDRVLAAASGTFDPNAPPQPAEVVEVPENAAQGLAVEGVQYANARGGGLTVSGTVANRGAQGAKVTNISVELLDASGKLVQKWSLYNPNLPTLAAGGEAPWQGLADLTVKDGQSVRLSAEGEIADAGR